jgi:hypothetical protein
MKENTMLFCEAVAAATANTTDAGKITLGGGYRLPVMTDAGKITLGGGYRLPVQGQ